MSQRVHDVNPSVQEKDGAGQEALPRELKLRLYRFMVLTRILDERALRLQRQGRIGFYVPCTGQEGAHIGAAAALEPEDWLFPSYRDQGVSLYRGIPVEALLHQCFGNVQDNTRGRQMPVHYSFRKVHVNSISSPIGTQIVHAAGAAIAAKIRKDPVVTMTFFGDGATSSNDFHTGMNFAGVFAAPCVFVCENNGWAISCSLDKQTASATLADKAQAYGMPGVRVDGNDALAVYRASREAVQRARAGGGPTLLELVTFRMGPHSSSDDPNRYRDPQAVAEWKRKDPIERLRQSMVREGLWGRSEEEALQTELKDEVQRAVDAAEKAGPPPLSSLLEDVYATLTPQLDEQWQTLKSQFESGILSGGQKGEFPL